MPWLLLFLAVGTPSWGADAAMAAGLSVAEKQALCLKEVTAEGMIHQQLGDETREGLYDFATCTELVRGARSLCAYFPGGPGAGFEPVPGLRRYKVTSRNGTQHTVFEYGVCDSRSAGYLFLNGLVAGETRENLLPFARRMLNDEPTVKPEDLVDVSSRVYHSQSLAAGALTDLVGKGFFNYLLGRRACGSVRFAPLRRECEWKGAAVDARRRNDRSLCVPEDLMCLASFDGEAACRAVGADAVRRFCTSEFPRLGPAEQDRAVLKSKL